MRQMRVASSRLTGQDECHDDGAAITTIRKMAKPQSRWPSARSRVVASGPPRSRRGTLRQVAATRWFLHGRRRRSVLPIPPKWNNIHYGSDPDDNRTALDGTRHDRTRRPGAGNPPRPGSVARGGRRASRGQPEHAVGRRARRKGADGPDPRPDRDRPRHEHRPAARARSAPRGSSSCATAPRTSRGTRPAGSAGSSPPCCPGSSSSSCARRSGRASTRASSRLTREARGSISPWSGAPSS